MSEVLDLLQSVLADRYVVEREVGRGGMAVVYVAEDVSHHSQFLSWVRRHDEAVSQILRAHEIDPVDPFIANNVSWRYYFARTYDWRSIAEPCSSILRTGSLIGVLEATTP